MVPGRKFSITTSAPRARLRTIACPSGSRRFTATDFLLRACAYHQSELPSWSLRHLRSGSASQGVSILITSAPNSASRRAQYGAAISVPSSITLMSARGPMPSILHHGRLAAIMSCAACALPGLPFAQASPAHHTREGFHNNYPHEPAQSFLLWQWERTSEGLPQAPPGGWQIPHVKTDAAALRANTSEPTLTWIGHSAFLLQLGGVNVLVDPQFSERASPVQFAGPRRIVPLPIDVAELPRIDVVLVTHNHYDHLAPDSVRRLAAIPAGSPLFLVPLGLTAWVKRGGITPPRG